MKINHHLYIEIDIYHSNRPQTALSCWIMAIIVNISRCSNENWNEYYKMRKTTRGKSMSWRTFNTYTHSLMYLVIDTYISINKNTFNSLWMKVLVSHWHFARKWHGGSWGLKMILINTLPLKNMMPTVDSNERWCAKYAIKLL